MPIEHILLELQRAFAARRLDTVAGQKELAALVNRPGTAEQLLRVVESGDLLAAQAAGLALPSATAPLVRRGLVRLAQTATGERRAIVLMALTPDELAKVSATDKSELLESLFAPAIVAVNDPSALVELLVRGRRHVDVDVVAQLERMRNTYELGPASLFGPLLDRPLTEAAKDQVLGLLGHTAGEFARALLEREAARATTEEDAKRLRRERMRQASMVPPASTKEGLGFLGAPGPNDAAPLEIYETLAAGGALRTTLVLGFAGVFERFATPVDDATDVLEQHRAAPERWWALTLGQVRTLVEALPAARRHLVAPLLERLAHVAAEPLPTPPPGGLLDDAGAKALVELPAWRDWRPFVRQLRWPTSLLVASENVETASFPAHRDHVATLAREQLGAALGEAGMSTKVAAGLRHLALGLQLSGDARASGVAAEALLASRKRAGPILNALAERELSQHLVQHASLPIPWRAQLRQRLRALLRPTESLAWEHVQRLDLAQAAAEGLAREACTRDHGLPPVDGLEVRVALQLAERARATLSEPALQHRARAKRFDVLSEAARGWLAEAGIAPVSEVARFAGALCIDACPHRCFAPRPSGDPGAAFEAACPGGPSKRPETDSPA